MKICSKCKIEKDEKEYYTYYHSSHKKFYTRMICLSCTRQQSREYKLKLRQQKKLLEQVPQEEKIIHPVVPELQPGYKECCDCYEVKSLDDYYLNAYKNPMKRCKVCYNSNYRKNTDNYNKERGGSERVPQTPGVYSDIYQEQQVTEFLTLLGWKLNPNGVWSKKGFKDENKVWEKPIKKYKRLDKGNYRGSERSPVYQKRLELIKLKDEGMTLSKIASIYGISPATTLRIIRDDYGK